MRTDSIRWLSFGLLALCLAVRWARADGPALVEGKGTQPWYMGLSAGHLNLEGDEVMEDAWAASWHLGYDWSDRWSFEGILTAVPDLDENFRSSYGRRISRMEEIGDGVSSSRSLGMAVEGLYYLTRRERLTPYLAGGGGLTWYADDIGRDVEAQARAGAGALCHLNDAWALRADGRVLFTSADTEVNLLLTVGMVWTPGAVGAGHTSMLTVPAAVPAAPPPDQGADADEDGDVQRFVLQIQFEPGRWEIQPEYYSEIGVIGKILKENPSATARIEGHIDLLPGTMERDHLRLTEKRANSVRKYLSDHWAVSGRRMKAVGYGTSRPVGPNDPVTGNLDNRRIEVYIRK